MEDAVMHEAAASSFVLQPLLSELQPQKRNPRVYTKEEWEAQKINIEHLYITKRKPLKVVAEFLENNYGFYATYG